MIPAFLGIDAGGTSTRAAIVLTDGTCIARSRQAGGNPTSRGRTDALGSIVAAAKEASFGAGPDVVIEHCLLAMAGERDKIDVPALAHAADLPPEAIRLVSDVAAMYFSGAYEPDGAAVIAGTGSIAARIAGGILAETAGGAGWLLGDGGSGFWIGQRVVQAVVADLSGLRPATTMTAEVLATLGAKDAEGPDRRQQLERLVRASYTGPPVQLSQLAPIAFAQAHTDATARRILSRAGEHLADLVDRFPVEGPLVVGGSVMTQGFLPVPGRSTALADALLGRDLRIAENGCAGAAFMSLQQSGLGDRAAHERIRATLTFQDRP